MSSWSLNLYGETDDADKLTSAITDAADALGAEVTGGTLNVADRPQVTFPNDPLPPAATTLPADPAAPEDAPADAGGGETSVPPEVSGTAPAAPAATTPDAFAGESVESLEAELNRRSSEGANVTSDGTPLQEAPAAEIEAEISRRGVAEPSGETGESPTDTETE